MTKFFLLKSTNKIPKELNENHKKVIYALLHPMKTSRYIGGIVKDSGIPQQEALDAINWLVKNNFGEVKEGVNGRLWSLTVKGKDVFKIA